MLELDSNFGTVSNVLCVSFVNLSMFYVQTITFKIGKILVLTNFDLPKLPKSSFLTFLKNKNCNFCTILSSQFFIFVKIAVLKKAKFDF